jgi:hypothetical protein
MGGWVKWVNGLNGCRLWVVGVMDRNNNTVLP